MTPEQQAKLAEIAWLEAERDRLHMMIGMAVRLIDAGQYEAAAAHLKTAKLEPIVKPARGPRVPNSYGLLITPEHERDLSSEILDADLNLDGR